MRLIRIENRIFNIDHLIEARYNEKGWQSRRELRLYFDAPDDAGVEEPGPYRAMLYDGEAEDAWGIINALMVSGGVPR